ncbi:MAG: class I SAM-dependent methyltransferase [Mariprofundaceae bacterium]|nr:class I SAM-dependent methyltransferase [Mariprofundaceae bacterium]
MMGENFDAKDYWEKRLQGNYDLHGVGLIEWGPWFNQWLYRIRRHGFLKTIRQIKSNWADACVLDIGSGTGFYLERWQEVGAKSIQGMDLTDVAVEQLQAKFPAMAIHCADIGAGAPGGMDKQFDAISCMDVLFHIVDDEHYQKAFENIAAMLNDDGLFVFSDSWLKGKDIRGVHIVHRSREHVQQALTQARLQVIEVHPMFVLLNAPVDSSNPLLRFWWWSLYQVSARFHRLGGVLAAVIYPLERLLLRFYGSDGPTTKVIVCKKME